MKKAKQNKHSDPLFRLAIQARAGHRLVSESWKAYCKRKRISLPKGI